MSTLHKKFLAGFTLLEILIALFIFTIISMLLVGALHTVLTSQSRTEKNSARLTQLQMTMLFISRDIEQVIDRPIINAQGQPEVSFLGTADSITFTHAGLANPLGQLQQSTLQRTKYIITNENIIRITWPVLDQTLKTQTNQRVLMDTVTELHFQYLDAKGKFQLNWPPDGQSKPELPRAVRVSFTLKNWGKISQLYLIPGQNLDTPI